MNPLLSPSANREEESPQQDAANREQALNPEHSFIIEAPAGAGKTELLTQRFLALLARVNEPEEIVALTFTNKAAAEMRRRVIKSLKMSASAKEPDTDHERKTYQLGLAIVQRDHERQWHLLEHAGRLQITTLDALCGKLARQMPLLSRLGSQPGIATDADPYYAQAAQATLQALEEGGGEEGEASAQSLAIARVLAYLDNDSSRFLGLVINMLASRDQWLRHSRAGVDLDGAQDALSMLVDQELHTIARVLPAGMQDALIPVGHFAASYVLLGQSCGADLAELAAITALEHWSQPLPAVADALHQWRALAELLLTKGGEIRSQLPAKLGFGTPQGKEMGKIFKPLLESLKDLDAAAQLARIRQLPNPIYEESERQLIQDLLVVLKVATASLWLAFKEAGAVDFTEMAQNALLALGDEEGATDLQLRLDYRISHLLVDEFQDTSPTQVDLIEKLTAGWQPSEGRTLFLVGDPMQSIYKFRKADVGLFLKVRDKGLGNIRLTPLKLYRNNRSYAQIVQWGNANFPAVFSEEDNFQRGAVRFAKAIPTKPSDPQSRIVWHPVIDTQGSEEEDDELSPASEREAQAVIRIVRQAQAEDPKGTIAILVRARSHLEALVKALRAQQPPLPYQAVEIEALSQRQSIQDLLSLTHALLHQGDRTHWLAILRAPWCGLLLQDLHALAADDRQAAIWSLMNDAERCSTLSSDGQARLAHVRDVLQESFEHQGRQRLRRWIEGTWQNLGGPNCLRSEADLLDTRAFFEAIDRLDEQGALDFGRLATEIESLYAAPDPTASAQLQIMTVHKSKGLEFDTVILPGLHKKPPPTDKKLMLWDEVIGEDGQEHLVVASLPSGQDAGTNEASKFGLLYQFEAERSRNESQRLLYVAVSRAKRQLHLLACARPDTKAADEPLKSPVKDSLLGLLWHVGRTEFEAAYLQLQQDQTTRPKQEERVVRIKQDGFNHRLLRLAQPQRPAALHKQTSQSSEQVSEKSAEQGGDENRSSKGQLSSDIGTLVHKYLEVMARDGLVNWNIERVQELDVSMQRWLRQQGHGLKVATDGAAEVIDHLVSTLQSETGRWILSPRDESGCEVAFTTERGGSIQTHIIDRTFVEDGVRWIVDYKTTRQKSNESVLQDYEQQLQRYRSLFTPKEVVRCATFFTRDAEFVEFTQTD